jgi:hypothetical protein
MTRDDIIEAASKAGFNWPGIHTTTIEERLERFANLIVAAERTRACRIVTGLCISDNNAREICEAVRSEE